MEVTWGRKGYKETARIARCVESRGCGLDVEGQNPFRSSGRPSLAQAYWGAALKRGVTTRFVGADNKRPRVHDVPGVYRLVYLLSGGGVGTAATAESWAARPAS
jgi:hypothetical protein